MRFFSGITAVFLMFAVANGPVSAANPLRNDETVFDGLMAVASADEIQKNCPTISPRLIRAFFFMKSLERHANRLGFSTEDIEAYVNDKDEQDVMRTATWNYLGSVGVAQDQPETFCEAGRNEITRKSQIGVLLRSK